MTFSISGATSQPTESGSFALSDLPANTTNVSFVSISAVGAATVVLTSALTASNSVAWTSTSLPAGPYIMQAHPSGEVAGATVHLHAGYDLLGVRDPLSRYSVAGRQSLTIIGGAAFAGASTRGIFADK